MATAPGPIGNPRFATSDGPNFPVDLTAVSDFFATAVGDTATSSSGLSSLTNLFVNKETRTLDTGATYVYTGSTGGWQQKKLFYSAAATANTLPAGGGVLGTTAGVNVPSSAYPRLVKVTLAGFAVAATSTVDFGIRQDGTVMKRGRAAANNSVLVMYEFMLAANTATSFQGVGTSTDAASWNSDSTLNYMTVTAEFL